MWVMRCWGSGVAAGKALWNLVLLQGLLLLALPALPPSVPLPPSLGQEGVPGEGYP